MMFSIVNLVAAAGGCFANSTGTPDSSIVSMIALPGWTPGLPRDGKILPCTANSTPPRGVADIELGLKSLMAFIWYVVG